MARFLDYVSQAQNSFSYSFVSILFFPVFLIIHITALIFGLLERKFLNKRTVPAAKLGVIITGCSTGFGNSLARSLATQKITVYAGVRKLEDADDLKSINENIVPIIADVTNPEQLKEAYETVRKHLIDNDIKLLALVNNAGYGYYSPIEATSIDKFKRMIDVNVYGVINATQVFVPLLRERSSIRHLKPRVINISSGAGHVVIPPSGTYCASKFALEAISDAMRIELAAWNIHVALIEPGRFKTEFQSKAYISFENEGIGNMSEDVEQHYDHLVKMTNQESEKKNRANQRNCVRVIEDSLFDTKPLARYLTGVDVQLGVPLVHFIKSEVITDRALGSKWRAIQRKK